MLANLHLYCLGGLGALCLLYGIFMCFTTNLNAGTFMVLAIGAFLVAFAVFYNIIRAKTALRLLSYAGFGGIAVLVALSVFIAAYGKGDNVSFKEDALIVLGCGIRGQEVSPQLKARLDSALAYAEKNPGAIIVVSGGQGPQEDIAEALAMERYLIKKGLPADRIIREDKSTSTYTNLVNSKRLLDKAFEGEYKVALLSNEYHILRAVKTAEDADLDCAHAHADTVWYEVPIRYLRECLALTKITVFGH